MLEKSNQTNDSEENDKVLLKELVDCGRLTPEQSDAFSDMLEKLENGVYDSLTKAQRKYVRGVHEKLGLDPGVRNMVSSGEIRVTEQERASLQSFLGSLGPLPKKPPGRR